MTDTSKAPPRSYFLDPSRPGSTLLYGHSASKRRRPSATASAATAPSVTDAGLCSVDTASFAGTPLQVGIRLAPLLKRTTEGHSTRARCTASAMWVITDPRIPRGSAVHTQINDQLTSSGEAWAKIALAEWSKRLKETSATSAEALDSCRQTMSSDASKHEHLSSKWNSELSAAFERLGLDIQTSVSFGAPQFVTPSSIPSIGASLGAKRKMRDDEETRDDQQSSGGKRRALSTSSRWSTRASTSNR